jgi:hypothetical protein
MFIDVYVSEGMFERMCAHTRIAIVIVLIGNKER